MRSLIVWLLVVDLYLAQKTHGFQIHDADLNKILDYLQQERYEENNKIHLDGEGVVPEIQSSGGGQRGAYQTFQYNRNGGLHETLEDIYPESNVEGLTHKSYNIPKINREPPVAKNNGRSNNVPEFSKVYLVLDPRANINTVDLKGISNIVSFLTSAKRNIDTKQKSVKQRRYKGFAVLDDPFSRRRSRDSNEKFSKDSNERDYKPKRGRGDYSVGAGRTAIPYIRHRGDIFERE